MEHNRDRFYNQKGLTLIEMLAVILIIMILATVAVMRLGSSANQLQQQNVARELKVAFERARFDSVKRRATDTGKQAKVEVAQNYFTLKTDINQDGTLETSEERVNTSWKPGTSIRRGDNVLLTSPATVAFNNRGEVVGGSVAFLVCNGDCSTPTSSNSNLVLVTPTGTVNILSGGATIPPFAAPNVTSVNSNTDIRPEIKIN